MPTLRRIAASLAVTALTFASPVLASDPYDRTCWWFWSPTAGEYVYDAEACPDGPDPGYPIDPDRIATPAPALPDTALPS